MWCPCRVRAAVAATWALGVMLAAGSAVAVAPPAACPAVVDQSTPTETLRALSLDLLGTVPTLAEYEAVAKAGAVAPSQLDAMLASDAFAAQAVRRHRGMLWIGLDNPRLLSVPQSMGKTGSLHWRSGGNVAFYHRGNRVPCVDQKAEWDQDGNLVFWPQADGTKREGMIVGRTPVPVN